MRTRALRLRFTHAPLAAALALVTGCPPPPVTPQPKPSASVAEAPVETGQVCSEAEVGGDSGRVRRVVVRGAEPGALLCDQVTLKAGGPADDPEADKSLRALYSKGDFADVVVVAEDAPDGTVVAFELELLPKLIEVRFDGAKAIDRVELLRAAGLAKLARARPERLRAARGRLTDLYRAQGYRNAKVEVSIDERAKEGAIAIFKVSEGDRFVLKSVKVEGGKSLDKKLVAKLAAAHVDQPLSDESSTALRLKLQSALWDRGFATSEVSEIEVTEGASGALAGTFKVTEGPTFKIGKVGLSGDPCVDPKKIEASIKAIKPGQLFARQKIADDLKALEASCAAAGAPRALDLSTQIDQKKKRVDVVIVFVPAAK